MKVRFFVDSNVIIETFKKNSNLPEATKIFKIILDDITNKYFINEVVFDECYYHLIVKGKLSTENTEEFLFNFIQSLNLLYIDEKVLEQARKYILDYRLKTHDALIISTVRRHQIPYLISLDTDFLDIATKENIQIVNSSKDLITIIEGK